MVRLLLFLVLLALAAYGLAWLAENPGDVALTFHGVEYDVSLMVAIAIVVGLAIVIALAWGVIRFVFRAPSLMSLAARARRREKGYAALSGGMAAVGSGDARTATRLAAEARKHLGDAPLTKLLRAQAAQLSGDRGGAAAAFRDMLDHPQTHALGLRGLHIEARRAGDHQAALEYARRAHNHAALPWAAQAVLDDRAEHGDWAGALAIVESNAAAKLIDKPTAARWRAALKTAMAEQAAERDPKSALALAREALALAPGLVPAAALAGRLLGANGDLRRAGKVLEAAWRRVAHPDLAAAYLRLRRGDSAADRFARAKTLARIAPEETESRLTLGRAALEARDLAAARAAVGPLIAPDAPSRPTARTCLLMADIETADGAEGAAREWLARAARAPRDKAWIADGVISDRWAPASPSGALDAFVWRAPDERLSAPSPPPPAKHEPAPLAAPAPPNAAPPRPPPALLQPRPVAPSIAANGPPRPTVKAVIAPTIAPDDPGPLADDEASDGVRRFAGD